MKLKPLPSSSAAAVTRTGRRRRRRQPIRDFSSHHSPPPPLLHQCSNPTTTTTTTTTATASTTTITDLIDSNLHLCPSLLRRLWRASSLPISLLLHHHPLAPPKIPPLLSLFLDADSSHPTPLPLSSTKPIIFLLLRSGFLDDATLLLDRTDSRSIPIETAGEIYGALISGHLKASRVGKALAFFDRSRIRGFTPEISSCEALLNALLEDDDHRESFLRVYMDLADLGFLASETRFRRFAMRSLCKEGRILEAADLLRRREGEEVDSTDFDMVVFEYLRRRHFDDLMGFLRQWDRIPTSPRICNGMVNSICEDRGTEEGFELVRSLEVLGFEPEARTFEILIAWSCREGKLRNAFAYLSQLLSRKLRPSVHCYNPIMCGLLLKEGMWEKVGDVFLDMVEFGVEPDASTFRIALAGYCKARRFDEARSTFKDMERRGIVSLGPSTEDPMSKVFGILGLGHLDVKVKRCKDVGIQKAEFHDSIGNGLYLDTDINEYDRMLASILVDAMVPDFGLLVIRECLKGNLDLALELKEENDRCGQDLPSSAYAALARCLVSSSSPWGISKVNDLVEEMPELLDRLDHGLLNQLVGSFCKIGFLTKARLVLEKLVRRKLPVGSDAYLTLLVGFSDQKNLCGFKGLWEFATKNGLLLQAKDFECCISCLCNFGMLKEALELFECMLQRFPSLSSGLYKSILRELCLRGSTEVAYKLWRSAAPMDVVFEEGTYEDLIKGLCGEKKLEVVEKSLDFMFSRNVTPTLSTFQLLIPLLLKSKEMEKAANLKRVMLDNKPESSYHVYKFLINALCSAGHMKEARLQLSEMKTKGLQPDVSILNSLLVGHITESNRINADEVLCLMLKKNAVLCISSYKKLVRSRCIQRRLSSALGLKTLFSVGNQAQLITLYNIDIFSLFQTGHGAFVDHVLNEIHEKKLMLDQSSYEFLIHGYNRSMNISKSVGMLYAMIKRKLRPTRRSFRTAICNLCNRSEVDRALELQKLMELWGIKHDSAIQSALVGCLLSQGKLDDAQALLARFERHDLVPNDICYNNLITMFCVHSRVDQAIKLLDMMLERGNLPSELSYNSVLDVLLRKKDFDLALDFIVEMHHKNLQPIKDICVALVDGLCGCGRTDDAIVVLELSLQSGQILPDHVIYSIIDGYVAENDSSKALAFMRKMQQSRNLQDFKTRWSLISNLNRSNDRHDKTFLSHLLSQSGFTSLVGGRGKQ